MIPTQDIEKLTDEQVVSLGLETLSRELGLYGYARFLMTYRPGTGDYTADRHQWLAGITIEQIAHELGTNPEPNDNPASSSTTPSQ